MGGTVAQPSGAGVGTGGAGAGAQPPNAGAAAGNAAAQAGAYAAGGGAGSAGSAGASNASAGAAATPSNAEDPSQFAAGLAALFLDVPCATATPTPLANGATCAHPPNTQHIEKMVSFGGASGKTYALTLRIRGIWEPTSITGGTRPNKAQPFTVGGKVTSGNGSSGDAINYQQYSIEVSAPAQVYWLNDYQSVAHDIHKEDYQATLQVSGGATLKVIMHDGNDHEIANWTKDLFSDVPPYDKMPSLGQSLRLDVVSVVAQ